MFIIPLKLDFVAFQWRAYLQTKTRGQFLKAPGNYRAR